MAVNFAAILGKQADTVEAPKNIPIGEYIAINQKLPEFKAIGQNETPGANFSLVILAATESVDPDQLKEFGDVKGKTIQHTMWLSENSEYYTIQELEKTFGIESTGKTIGQMFNETINKQVIVSIEHVPTKDGTAIRHQSAGLAAA